MGGIFGGGSSTTQVINQTPAPSQQELDLIGLNSEIARKQLSSLDQIQPFQQQLLDLSLADLRRQGTNSAAMDAAVSPEQQAAAYKADFERSQRLGPAQDELMQLQLDQLRRGGAATPEQVASIKAATDAGIASGSADIDASTQRGIGMIGDELANSRGLRLSDSPIGSEAALLAREGVVQKGSLIKGMESAGATARLNFPLAAQQVQSGIASNQQQLATAAQQFQAGLRNQAFQNRLALTGQAQSGGIGLASINDGGRALGALQANRFANTSSTQNMQTNPGFLQVAGGLGQFASGIGALSAFSDPRLKDDFGVVAETKEGLPLHVYRYKGESPLSPLRLGVMADEVERVRPDAVFEHSSGYKVVNYSGIGLSKE